MPMTTTVTASAAQNQLPNPLALAWLKPNTELK
jgi:hypothetical protein